MLYITVYNIQKNITYQNDRSFLSTYDIKMMNSDLKRDLKGLFSKKEAGFPLIRLVDIKNAICYHKLTFHPNRSYNIGSPMEKQYT